MAWSSTGRWLGFWLLVIQPSSVLPSNSSSQPSAFSASVKRVVGGQRGKASTASKNAKKNDFFMVGISVDGARWQAATADERRYSRNRWQER